ncbi:hypothetical protein QYE76_026367 [Lolium multiflorum]|uniref:Uncharacterized protein n=1 Tax=Lolium multiflorum TaxID=4521 RepID=A0AAD8RG28_LOLMU|nr:hypothetical protein QYE76_026367 [Lolium multiflorum]
MRDYSKLLFRDRVDIIRFRHLRSTRLWWSSWSYGSSLASRTSSNQAKLNRLGHRYDSALAGRCCGVAAAIIDREHGTWCWRRGRRAGTGGYVDFHGAELIYSTNLLVMKPSATSTGKAGRRVYEYGTITWMAMIAGYAQNGRVNELLEVYA